MWPAMRLFLNAQYVAARPLGRAEWDFFVAPAPVHRVLLPADTVAAPATPYS